MSTMEERIRDAAREYLEQEKVTCVIGYERSARGVVRPAFIYEPDEAEQLVWGPDCNLDLVTYLHNHKHPPRRGVAQAPGTAPWKSLPRPPPRACARGGPARRPAGRG